jgi:hypothetical protein
VSRQPLRPMSVIHLRPGVTVGRCCAAAPAKTGGAGRGERAGGPFGVGLH